ncbi:MAG: hypothetical protein DMG06_02580 [Acidobacteria bacterium]|nr:MAG: hypothetical protein DMG06_02580 [Acidobacteriota bacterium]
MIKHARWNNTRRLLGILLIGYSFWPASSPGLSLSSVEIASKDRYSPEAQPSQKVKLSPGASEVARLIGVAPLLERLERLPEPEQPEARELMSPQALALRQRITESVLGTSLEVDGVFAEIDSEIAQTNEIRTFLESRRDHAIGINALSNIVSGGGLGIVGSALQIGERTNKLGNAVGVAAGSVTTVLSVLGLRQQHGGHHTLGIAPNMLAKIFDRPPEFHSDYPEEVWSYLNSTPPSQSGTETRRALLIKRWTELGRMDPIDTPKGRQKVEFLTSSVSAQRTLTIDLLADRAAMLSDVRATVSLMKRDLSKLMLALNSLK